MKLNWRRRHARYRRKMFRQIVRDGSMLAWISWPDSSAVRVGLLTRMLGCELAKAAKVDHAAARVQTSDVCDALEEYIRPHQPPRRRPSPTLRESDLAHRVAEQNRVEEEKTESWRSRARVYFIQQNAPNGDGPIKIGVSADLRKRMSGLAVASPHPLSVIALVPGDDTVEYRIQQRFSHARLSGEWFRPVPELFEFIKKLLPMTREEIAALVSEGWG